jgi:hypothetical protein
VRQVYAERRAAVGDGSRAAAPVHAARAGDVQITLERRVFLRPCEACEPAENGVEPVASTVPATVSVYETKSRFVLPSHEGTTAAAWTAPTKPIVPTTAASARFDIHDSDLHDETPGG